MRCDAAYEIAGEAMPCAREAGHEGVHLADVIFNGEVCSVGWTDADRSAIPGHIIEQSSAEALARMEDSTEALVDRQTREYEQEGNEPL